MIKLELSSIKVYPGGCLAMYHFTKDKKKITAEIMAKDVSLLKNEMTLDELKVFDDVLIHESQTVFEKKGDTKDE